jgi:hypothetical protein
VPVGLIALFTVAFLQYDVPAQQLPLVSSLAQVLTSWGVNANVLSGPRLGDLLFTAAFNLMLLTVGWHYTKQVFGCMMVYAYFDGYTFSKSQRALTKWSLLSIWGMNFVYSNLSGSQYAFSQFKYYSFDLPDVSGPIAQSIVIAGFVLVCYQVFYLNYRTSGQRPSVNLLVPFVALYIWWLPQTRQFEFYFLLTPLFHSLQYLAFVYKLEHSRLKGMSHPEVRGTVIVFGVILAGWLAFELLPNTLDTSLGTFNSWQMFFFFTAAMLFINIHHYFLDNVLWRFKDREVRDYLLA